MLLLSLLHESHTFFFFHRRRYCEEASCSKKHTFLGKLGPERRQNIQKKIAGEKQFADNFKKYVAVAESAKQLA